MEGAGATQPLTYGGVRVPYGIRDRFTRTMPKHLSQTKSMGTVSETVCSALQYGHVVRPGVGRHGGRVLKNSSKIVHARVSSRLHASSKCWKNSPKGCVLSKGLSLPWRARVSTFLISRTRVGFCVFSDDMFKFKSSNLNTYHTIDSEFWGYHFFLNIF